MLHDFIHLLQQFKFALLHSGGIHTDKDVKLARLCIVFHLLIPEFERFNINREADGLGFTWLKIHFFKTFQLFYRTTHGGGHIL